DLFKYNPPSGGPADADATDWIAARANDYLRQDLAGVKRISVDGVLDSRCVAWDYLNNYVADLGSVIDMEAIAKSEISIGADPLGGASVDSWGAIAKENCVDLTGVSPEVRATFRFMPLHTVGNSRVDCSSPHAMASLIDSPTSSALAAGNAADGDRHGIVTPDAGLMNPNHYL